MWPFGDDLFPVAQLHRERRVQNLISSSDIYYCNSTALLIGLVVCIIKGKTILNMVFITVKKKKKIANLASMVRGLSVCIHQSPDGRDQRMCSKSGKFNNRLGSCMFSKLCRRRTKTICLPKEDFGMLKALHHISASHLRFTVHAWLACFNGFLGKNWLSFFSEKNNVLKKKAVTLIAH